MARRVLEASEFWSGGDLISVSKPLIVRKDAQFMEVAELYRRRADLDVTTLVTELVESDGSPVPARSSVYIYGPQKARQWQQTWQLQRREMRERICGRHSSGANAHPRLLVNSGFWSLRENLMSMERLLSYPHAGT